MTNREKQIQSMLNYYGIDMGGTRDEKMNKTQKKKFLDTFNGNYDAQTVQDILQKVRDKLKGNIDNTENFDEEKDPFFDSLKESSQDNKDETFPIDMNSLSKNFGMSQAFGMNPDIENFINWLSDTLYSADHKVIITEEGGITNIRLEKIKKKRGGRKK